MEEDEEEKTDAPGGVLGKRFRQGQSSPPPAVRVLPPAPNLLPNVAGEKEEKEAPAPPHLQVNSLPEVLVVPEDPKQWG